MFPEPEPQPTPSITPIPLPRARKDSVTFRDGYVTPSWPVPKNFVEKFVRDPRRAPGPSIPILQPPIKRMRTRSAFPSGPLTKDESFFFSDAGRFPEMKVDIATIDGVEYEVGYQRVYIKKRMKFLNE